ncbi:MAG TPA: NosD domain-containing protein [Candidatus Nanopelagicaceae bacterium]|nr:NosD domain-containing protein [Candidatus Nanopelagicaceae bacterium]
MKSRAKSRIIVLITLVMVFSLSLLIFNNTTLNDRRTNTSSENSNLNNKNLKNSVVSEKIQIINNSGWVDFRNSGNCTGEGTYSDPYVIEDLEIDGGGSGSCILIENSSVYFKIENCTLYNTGYNSDYAGIRLSNANNSRIIMNNCSSNYNGIYLTYSSNVTISGNTANNSNSSGIKIYYSNNNSILGSSTNYNLIGIIISYSDYNTISGNIANISYNSAIIVEHSNFSTISGNTANNAFVGILIGYSNFNNISGNTANYNDRGIYLATSNYNTISGNILIGNLACIFEKDCEGNKFSDNGSCTYGQAGDIISGYNLFFLLGILSVIGIILSKKVKRI